MDTLQTLTYNENGTVERDDGFNVFIKLFIIFMQWFAFASNDAHVIDNKLSCYGKFCDE